MNDQRKVIYEQRKELMAADNLADEIVGMRHYVVEEMVTNAIPAKSYADEWNMHGLHEEVLRIFGIDLPVTDWAAEEGIADQEIIDRIIDATDRKAAEKVAKYSPVVMRDVEKNLYLSVLDQLWKDHLLTLDHLRQGIGLRAYAQKDPLNEYKKEAFDMFEQLLDHITDRVTSILAHIELQVMPQEGFEQQGLTDVQEGHQDPAFLNPLPKVQLNPIAAHVRDASDPETWGRVGRNEACPCESGKKFKQCHGKVN